MKSKEDMAAIDQALAEIESINTAPAQYARLVRQIERLVAAEPTLAADAIENVVERAALERRAEELRAIVKSPRPFLAAALERLRTANGVETVHVVTPELGDLALRRIEQGYSLKQVGLMIGCTAGTVSSIKAGRYRFSELPAGTKIGSRGRSRTS